MRLLGGQCYCALFSEVRIWGDAAFTRKPIDHQNGERDTVATSDVRARGQWTFLLQRHSPSFKMRPLSSYQKVSENKQCHLHKIKETMFSSIDVQIIP